MIQGHYTRQLYCDTPGCGQSREGWVPRGQLADGRDEPPFVEDDYQSGAEARQIARVNGWKLNLVDGTCLCPDCARKDLDEREKRRRKNLRRTLKAVGRQLRGTR